jgi:hypothetical protein
MNCALYAEHDSDQDPDDHTERLRLAILEYHEHGPDHMGFACTACVEEHGLDLKADSTDADDDGTEAAEGDD